MAKISKTLVDADLRSRVFSAIFDEFTNDAFQKINDRQYGIILTDKNGVERYVRIGAIVAEEREDKTARELMKEEIKAYQEKQAEKAEKAKAKEKKIAKDKEAREKKLAEKKGE